MLSIVARALVEEEPQIPLFDNTPSNITAIAGETAILPCAVDRKGDYRVISKEKLDN